MASNRSQQPKTIGSVSSKTAPTVEPSDNDAVSPSINMSAMDTVKPGTPAKSQSPSMSVPSITTVGPALTAWSQPALSYSISLGPLDAEGLTQRVQNRLSSYCAGMGMTTDEAVRSILDFLDGGGYALQAETLEDAVSYYLDNFWYSP